MHSGSAQFIAGMGCIVGCQDRNYIIIRYGVSAAVQPVTPVYNNSYNVCVCACVCVSFISGPDDRQTDKETDKQADTQTKSTTQANHTAKRASSLLNHRNYPFTVFFHF